MPIFPKSDYGGASDHLTILPVSFNSINQGTWLWSFSSNHLYGAVWYNSSAADGDSLTYKVGLGIGTYTLSYLGSINTNYGIMKVDIGGVNIATFDNYNSSLVRNMLQKQENIIITTDGCKDLTIYIDGKNASSSGYYTSLQHIAIWKTS